MRVDFGKFMRICQLEKSLKWFFLTFFLISCSHEVIVEKVETRKFPANWLRIDENYALRGKDGEFLTHPFFDIAGKSTDTAEIQYFTMTPENSRYQYNLDLLSGSLYKVREYCATDDIWDGYSSKIEKPNFDLGGIPRVFDQTGEVQKIIVFKLDKNLSKFEYNITHFNEARLLGSMLIERCDSYPCATKDKWKQFQVLIGVNKADQELAKIATLAELKKVVNWKYTRAFFLNQFGSHQMGTKYFPAFRNNADLDLAETIRHYKKSAKFIDIAEQVKLRDSCMDLYGDMWKKVQAIRAQEHNQQDAFFNFFKEFYLKNSTQYFQCQKLVRPANINIDHERHWFFTYISAFVNLEKSGLFYNCNQRGWAYNARVDEEHFYVDQNKELARCRAKDFEASFDQAINGMTLLRSQINRFFHYIEYDSDLGGTHQKLYSWILDDIKKTPCEKEFGGVEIFPQDVVWRPFKEDEAKTIH